VDAQTEDGRLAQIVAQGPKGAIAVAVTAVAIVMAIPIEGRASVGRVTRDNIIRA
jgi:hypothetical protein